MSEKVLGIIRVGRPFDIPYSNITRVELKKKWRGIRINIEINDETGTYWGKWQAKDISEKEKTKIEDYEDVLRPVFGDNLSVKK